MSFADAIFINRDARKCQWACGYGNGKGFRPIVLPNDGGVGLGAD